MRVLLVSPHFPPGHVGGVEYHTERLAGWLQRSGVEPHVVCVERVSPATRHGVVDTIDGRYGFPVHRLDVSLAPEKGGFRLYAQDPALERWMTECLARIRAHVVHLHSGYLLGDATLAAARALGVPAIVTLHDLWFICPRITMMHPDLSRCSGPESDAKCAWCLRTERRRFRLVDRWTGGALGHVARPVLAAWPGGSAGSPSLVSAVARRQRRLLGALEAAPVVLSPSRFVRRQLEKAGFPAARIRIVPYGITPLRAPQQARRGPPGPLRIAYMGQLAPHKGIHVLLHAARALGARAFGLTLFGPEGPHPEYVARLRRIARGDPRIRFAGAYANEQVDQLLADVDVLVVPSVWHENWPFVVLEAFRAGVPVIASRIGGLPEMIHDGEDGLLFETGSVRELTRCLLRLIDQPTLLRKLAAGIKPVRSEREEQEELLELYTRAAGTRCDPRGERPPAGSEDTCAC